MSLNVSPGDLHTCCFLHSAPLVSNSYPSERSLKATPTSFLYEVSVCSQWPLAISCHGLSPTYHSAVYLITAIPMRPLLPRAELASLLFITVLVQLNSAWHIAEQGLQLSVKPACQGENGIYKQSFPANWIHS